MTENTHCKHWQGSINELCGAGLNWRELTGGDDTGVMVRCPCVNLEHASKCESHLLMTEEEFAAEQAEMARIIAMHVEEFAYWDKLKAENKRGTTGVCPCPRCEGHCQWSIAATNGHLWVKCQSTEGCVAFME